jgi:F0F1-type ATP synthase membrane subunit b/b'
MPAPLSPDEIKAILQHEERRAARPEPVTMGGVGAQMAQAAVAGLGAALLLGGGAMVLGAPAGIAGQVALTAAVLATGIGLALRVVPDNKMATINRMRRVQRTVIEAEYRKREAYRAIEQLEQDHAAALQQMQYALAELRNENKALRSNLLRYQEAQRSPNYTTKSNVQSEVVGDATKILEHWFSTLRSPNAKGEVRGEWWSRPKSEAAGWGRSRQPAAAELLADAGIVDMNGTVPYVLPQYKALDAALFALNKYCGEAAAEPDLQRRQDSYVEPD